MGYSISQSGQHGFSPCECLNSLHFGENGIARESAGMWTQINFSPDGRSLFGNGTTVFSLRLDTTEKLIEWMEQTRYLRDLSCEERELYRVEPLCSE